MRVIVGVILKLLAIILNYRVASLTIDCLRSLAHEMPSLPRPHVVVVENGSGDDSSQRLCHAIQENGWASWAELLPLGENRGFSRGNNVAIRRAMTSSDPPDYVLLLNPDTIVRQGAVSRLVRFMDDHPGAGIAGPRLVYPDGTPHGSPFRFHSPASEFDRGFGFGIVSRMLARWDICLPKPAAASPVGWVEGSAMLIRRAVIEKLGPLDEAYFAYYEDTDYCLNARRAGWETWYVPDSVIVHLKGRSSGIAPGTRERLPEYWFQARRCYFLKNHGMLYAAASDAAFLAGSALGKFRRMLQGRSNPYPPHLLRDTLRHSVLLTGFSRPAQ
jgi:N-acetylglucosaminyl-diphospho-decaprenol L-rhamnosyltransferase